MPDPRFFGTHAPIAIADAAVAVDAAGVATYCDGVVERVGALHEDDLSGAVVYCASEAAREALRGRAFGLCLTSAVLAKGFDAKGEVLVVAAPRTAFAMLAEKLHYSLEEAAPDATGEARIHPDADIHPTANIGPGAEIAAGARIGAYSHIGRGVVVGEGARIESHVSITHAKLGRGGHILAGARLGDAGFGYVETPGGLMHVPQLGRVIIGDDVDIGANTTIDRGALGDTLIGDGTKIDNLVQIAHNTVIGRYCVIAGLTGISGSCVVGDGVKLGGQVGLADHVSVGDGAQVGAQSGVIHNVPAGEKWFGTPAQPVRAYVRKATALARLAKKKNG